MPNLRAILDSFTGDGAEQQVPGAEGWGQGRTLYGGITAALATHAALRAMPDLPPLRSAQYSFVGPAAGPLTFSVELLRRGRSTAVVSVDCRTAEGLAARAMLVFGAARDSRLERDDMPMPEVPAPDALEPFHRKPPKGLGFPQHFEMKLAAGGRPASGGDPQLLVWSRLREEEGVEPLIALIALADALPPPALAMLDGWVPVSTVTWAVDLFQPVDRGGWHLLQSVAEQTGEGYSLQGMNLWNDQGRRVIAARQVVAIFG